jgi:hypothetical protein
MKKFNWKNIAITLLAISNLLLIRKLDSNVEPVHTESPEEYNEVEHVMILNENQKLTIRELQVRQDELLGDIDYWYRQYEEQLNEVEYYKNLLSKTDEI